MDNSYLASRRHGLTIVQWGLLILAFMAGLGSSLVIREVFPPAHANMVQTANVVQTAPSTFNAVN